MRSKKQILLGVLVKTMLFVSSYFPLYILLTILNWKVIDRVFLGKANCYDYVFLGIILGGTFFSIVVLYMFLKIGEGNYIEYVDVERPDDKTISYVFTYIVPILSMNIESIELVIVNILLICLVCGLYSKLELFYINPSLVFMGYKPYSIGGKIIMTDIPFRVLKRNKKLSGIYITDNIFIAKKRYNFFL